MDGLIYVFASTTFVRANGTIRILIKSEERLAETAAIVKGFVLNNIRNAAGWFTDFLIVPTCVLRSFFFRSIFFFLGPFDLPGLNLKVGPRQIAIAKQCSMLLKSDS